MKKYILPISILVIIIISIGCIIYYNKIFDIEDTIQSKKGVFSYTINTDKKEK